MHFIYTVYVPQSSRFKHRRIRLLHNYAGGLFIIPQVHTDTGNVFMI